MRMAVARIGIDIMKYECPRCKGRLIGTADNDIGTVPIGDSMRASGIVRCSDCGKSFEITQYYIPVSDYELEETEE